MKNLSIQKSMLFTLIFYLLISGCKNQEKPESDVEKINIPKGEVTVATYYFPNWGPVSLSEWERVKSAEPRFEGHQQPKVPLWGYQNENKPEIMEKKIDAAADHGLDVFIFDWYYYDDDPDSDRSEYQWDGNKFLYMALEEGFLPADNNDRMDFSVMWCNHDLGNQAKGAVAPETFESLTDYVIENYFGHPSYWKIDGKPYFSIYQMKTFIETYDNDLDKAADAIKTFRKKVKAAGFPDLHLNAVLWGLKGDMDKWIDQLGINSTTSYVWVHHGQLPEFPGTEYTTAAEDYFESVESGGGSNGLEEPADRIPVPYHINVSMGWDSSPRCPDVPDSEWMERRDYPFGPVIENNSPYLFKKYLAKAKSLTMEKPEEARVITINSWNEWGEGSYLEPDTIHKMEYLEAIQEVFGD